MSIPDQRIANKENREMIMRTKRSRQEIVGLVQSDNLDLRKSDLQKVDLSNANITKADLSFSDVRGIKLNQSEMAQTVWKEAVFADLGQDFVDLREAKAHGAVFGYEESLVARRARHLQEYEATQKGPPAEDTGAMFGLNARKADLSSTEWKHVDFGGNSGGYRALFEGANLEKAVMVGSDLSEVDLSTCNIEGIQIIDPVSLENLVINQNQIRILINAIRFTNPEQDHEYQAILEEKGSLQMLEEDFNVIIVEEV
jgi:uncharacterized protein YjbI with pentapeptide repeats